MPDIDIDLLDRDKALDIIRHVPASIWKDNKITKHNTGVYAQDIPVDPVSGLASLDYEVADKLGYFKIDFLNVSAYEGVRDEQHLVELMYKEPDWSMLKNKDIVSKLFHISDHYGLVNKLNPQSIDQLAAVLAIIRPGKRHLADSDWNTITKDVWIKPQEGYFFKKAHAIGYAYVIVVQMNLLNFTDQS
jgi:DNA polymerase III alpha subunit